MQNKKGQKAVHCYLPLDFATKKKVSPVTLAPVMGLAEYHTVACISTAAITPSRN